MANKKIINKSEPQKPVFNPSHDIDWRTLRGYIPTRTFEIGEIVKYGNHDRTQVQEIFYHNGVACNYGIRNWGTKMKYGVPVEYSDNQIVSWYRLSKINSIDPAIEFFNEKDFYIHYSNYDIEGIISKVLSPSAGVNFEPTYQRDYVWSDIDRENLITSIFNNNSIGSFVFSQNGYIANTEQYEIIDGKQRLTTIVDFFEDRFTYNGYYFSMLSKKDQNHFLGLQVSFGTLNGATLKQKLAAFISLNTSGKVMDSKHLKNVIDMYNELD
jgi:hypothetical protein